MSIRIFLFVAIFVLQAALAGAEEGTNAKDTSSTTPDAATVTSRREPPEKEHSVTQHSMKIGGRPLDYTATAGTLRMRNDAGKYLADIFFVSYTREEEDRTRPITFLFNGGPGAASMWLHMGAAGPRRVLPLDGDDAGPRKTIDNAQTWLDFTDLVFIDPVGTGYSRAAPGENEKQFFGTREDIESVGNFIRLYTTKYGRWLSPLFLAGESYGTYRAVGLAEDLYDRFGMNVNGLILISLAINFQPFSFELGNDLPYVAFLPTYAAAAWYHKKLAPQYPGSLEKTLQEAEKWALNDYVVALARGHLPAGPERERAIEGLERYTGLSREIIERRDLRIDRSEFMKELLKSENRKLSLMDARASRYGDGQGFMGDPSIVASVGAYAPAINDYLRNELQYETDLPYIFLSEAANSSWNWGKGLRGHVSLLDSLQKTLNRNRKLKVYAASGCYDLDTPYFGTTYLLNHLGVDPSVRDNVIPARYESGHMLYMHAPSLERLTADVAAVMESAQ